jgi:Zn-dependent metalloprotease
MVLEKSWSDELGFTHHHFQQTYKGVKVQGAEFRVHEREGRVETANGKLATDLELDVVPVYTRDMALSFALAYVGAKTYKWENEQLEQEIKRELADPAASWLPEGELLILGLDSQEGYRLCWRFDIYALDPEISKRLYVDAKSGKVVKEGALEIYCSSGSGTTTHYGTKTVHTNYRSIQNDYNLKDNCHSGGPVIETMQRITSINNDPYLDADNNWTSSSDEVGVTAHWAVHRAYDYFLNVHSRNSFNGSGGNVNIRTHWIFGSSNTFNAAWNEANNRIAIGSGAGGSPSDHLTALDVLAHEFTHGVIRHTADLDYERESGALNESFGDIFGTAVEEYEEGAAYDWTIAEDVSNWGPIRNMSNPGSYGDPSTYGNNDPNWINTNCGTPNSTNDYCGVHTNSGVQNFWFFLLVSGSSGTNANGKAYQVTGIGIDKAKAIAYRSLANYLTSTSEYVDAREGSIRAAKDLYGSCSNEVVQVGNAWDAVGVGTGLSEYNLQVCGIIPFPLPPFQTGYQGINTLVSGGSGCGTMVQTGSLDITFASPNRVTLSPGFSIQLSSGGSFSAFLDPCAISAYRIPGKDSIRSARILENSPAANFGLTFKAYPNPFSGSTRLEFHLPARAPVWLEVRNPLGQRVARLAVGDFLDPGKHEAVFDGNGFPPGMYLATLRTGKKAFTVKLILTE